LHRQAPQILSAIGQYLVAGGDPEPGFCAPLTLTPGKKTSYRKQNKAGDEMKTEMLYLRRTDEINQWESVKIKEISIFEYVT